MDLPPGLTSRALTLADTAAAWAVMAAQERGDLGEVAIEEADLVGDWSRPGADLATGTVGVFDGGELVAYGEVSGHGRFDVAVRPEHRGRGLGTALAGWARGVARARGLAEIGTPVPQGSPGDRLLAGLGYRVRWTSWALELPAGARVPDRALPDGYLVRAAAATEHEQCWTVQEDAFLEWSVRERSSFADWRAEITGRPGFEPWNLRVVVDPDGRVVSMAWVQLGSASDGSGAGPAAFVARLATRREERGRGLAQALLVDCFAEAGRHGAVRSELSTDSRTGALGLYEKVGMVVTSTWLNRGVRLEDGAVSVLPEGLTTRPLTIADAEAVAAVIGAEEIVDVGEPEMTVEDLVSDWQRPSYDIGSSTVGVFDGERLVAYADVATAGDAYTAVDPPAQGRGIGTWLAGWVQATARERGSTLIGTQVPQGSAADRLMNALGYELRWTSWELELPEGAEIVGQPLPDGYVLRDATSADSEAVWTLVEDAFLEWSERDRRPLADFGALVWERPGFEPWNLRLLHDPAGELVGATQVILTGEDGTMGHVPRIAVRADRRGLGLARAMLVDAFALARAHGAVRCGLSTDTRTGALGLYERVGMVVTSTWVNRAIRL